MMIVVLLAAMVVSLCISAEENKQAFLATENRYWKEKEQMLQRIKEIKQQKASDEVLQELEALKEENKKLRERVRYLTDAIDVCKTNNIEETIKYEDRLN